MKSLLIIFCFGVCVSACKNANESGSKASGVDILKVNVDSSVNPADDFFEYANGGWIKNNPIPGDETGWGIANLVNEELYKRKLRINEEAVKKSNSPINQMIASFWLSGMDTINIEKEGLRPLQEE